MKKNVALLILVSVIFFCGCSKKNAHQDVILQGATSTEDFYTDTSFFNKDTVSKTFINNNLDFWLFVKGSHGRDNNKLSKTISGLCKKFSGNKKMILTQEDNFSVHTFNDTVTGAPLFFFPQNKEVSGEIELPPAVRELNPPVLFTTVSVDFQGKLTSYFDNYIEHLDRGFIAGVSMTAEILGPEWKIENTSRLFIKAASKKRDSIRSALLNRRTYISFEKNTFIDFKIGDYSIGDIIEKTNNVYNYSITIKQPGVKIGKAELISNNDTVIASYSNINSNNFTKRNSFSTNNSFNYFLLKIYFENGKIAYTSPIWLIKEKVISLNNTTIKLQDKKGNVVKKISYGIENLTKEGMENVTVRVSKQSGEILVTDRTSLKGREYKRKELLVELDNTSDEAVNLTAFVDTTFHATTSVTIPGSNLKKILIDKLHSNASVDNMTLLKKYLDKAGYITTFADNPSYQAEDVLKSYNLFIITAPGNISEDAVNEITYLYALHKFVYEGGSLLLAGTNDDKSRVSINYLNRILKIVYSPVKYRFEDKIGSYAIYDEINNYSNKYLPVFTTFNTEVFDKTNINKIYMRYPVEIFGQSGSGEMSLSTVYNTIPLATFAPTTAIENRKIYNYSASTPAVIVKFGKGYICILSGINFSDYDIEKLDNKKWIMGIIDYITKKK